MCPKHLNVLYPLNKVKSTRRRPVFHSFGIRDLDSIGEYSNFISCTVKSLYYDYLSDCLKFGLPKSGLISEMVLISNTIS